MNPEIKLNKAIETGSISHAYIFEGDSLSKKGEIAQNFLRRISGVHSLENCLDYYELKAEAGQGRTVKSIKDDELEKLQANLKMKPDGSRNMALIYDADTMTVRAQNRFLKTLEEPQPGTVIILLSENTENLLETIRSRCVILRFASAGSKTEGSEYEALIESITERRSFHDAKKQLTKAVKSRDDAYEFLDTLEYVYRDMAVLRPGTTGTVGRDEAVRAIELIEETRRAILRNASYGYALKNLLLKL